MCRYYRMMVLRFNPLSNIHHKKNHWASKRTKRRMFVLPNYFVTFFGCLYILTLSKVVSYISNFCLGMHWFLGFFTSWETHLVLIYESMDGTFFAPLFSPPYFFRLLSQRRNRRKLQKRKTKPPQLTETKKTKPPRRTKSKTTEPPRPTQPKKTEPPVSPLRQPPQKRRDFSNYDTV